MKTCFSAIVAALLLALAPVEMVRSDHAPLFMKETLPEQALESALAQFEAVMSDAALDSKTKELIALAVSAQVPCEYCVYYHRKAATHHGASDAQLREALAVAALVRYWSTTLNGSDYDIDQWRLEVRTMFAED